MPQDTGQNHRPTKPLLTARSCCDSEAIAAPPVGKRHRRLGTESRQQEQSRVYACSANRVPTAERAKTKTISPATTIVVTREHEARVEPDHRRTTRVHVVARVGPIGGGIGPSDCRPFSIFGPSAETLVT
jgi:hypothetical protein